jgi:hypothetical protein
MLLFIARGILQLSVAAPDIAKSSGYIADENECRQGLMNMNTRDVILIYFKLLYDTSEFSTFSYSA